MNASYRVKIEGRLLDDVEDENALASGPEDMKGGAESNFSGAPSSKHCLSHFFREMNVDFDQSRSRVAADQAVSWTKAETKGPSSNQPSAVDVDELTFKRNGDENMNIVIKLTRDENPARFQLSPELSNIVDKAEATRDEATLAVWDYIRLMGLQEDEDKRNFRCDSILKKVRSGLPFALLFYGPDPMRHRLSQRTWDLPQLSRIISHHTCNHFRLSLCLTQSESMRSSTKTRNLLCTTFR